MKGFELKFFKLAFEKRRSMRGRFCSNYKTIFFSCIGLLMVNTAMAQVKSGNGGAKNQTKQGAATLPAKTRGQDVLISRRVGKNDTIVMQGWVIEGDTVPYIALPDVNVAGQIIYHNDAERLTYLRLKRDVQVVLPYAQYAGYRYKLLKAQLETTTDRKQRRILIKSLQKDIKENYEKPLKNLTVTQGRILIKLVDRETGQTTYEILKEMKSGFSAFIFQSVAGLIGDNLKDKYDPVQDKDIEFIIQSMGY